MLEGIFKRKRDSGSGAKASQAESSSDLEFLEEIYHHLLGRGVDETGKSHYLGHLKEGHSRLSVILSIVRSEEFINKVIRENTPILTVIEERPDRYRLTRDIHGKEAWVFQAESPEDFDWLERKVVENGYYEMPGVWSYLISEDKRLHAEMISLFKPQRVLDFGCANGPVMKCLLDLGIPSEGVDISRLALAKAFPDIKKNIHLGDLLALDLKGRFDFILGLDIFEHLNPNKLEFYLAKIAGLMEEGGYLFGNIPAFGKDEVFGTVFEVYLREWEADIREQKLFSVVHTDASGYPVNGHMIGAGSGWWVKQFERKGLRREVEVEKALHKRYDETITRIHVARKSFFIFSKTVTDKQRGALLKRLAV